MSTTQYCGNISINVWLKKYCDIKFWPTSTDEEGQKANIASKYHKFILRSYHPVLVSMVMSMVRTLELSLIKTINTF